MPEGVSRKKTRGATTLKAEQSAKSLTRRRSVYLFAPCGALSDLSCLLSGEALRACQRTTQGAIKRGARAACAPAESGARGKEFNAT